MRKFLVVISIMFSVAFAFAQGVDVRTESKPMSLGTNTSFVIDIPKAKLKEVETLWGKYVSRNSKNKIVNNKGEWTMTGAVDRNVGASPFNVYALMLETSEGVKLSTFFAEGDYEPQFVNDKSAEDKLIAIKKYVTDFGNIVKRSTVEAELEAEQKGLKVLEKDLKEMEKDFDKSNQSIGEYNRKIERNLAEIKKIELEVDAKNAQIVQQKDAIVKMASALGDEKKVAQKTLSGFENDRKKLLNQKDKLGKDIDKCKTNIREEERNIAKLNNVKAAKRVDIEKQEAKVKAVEERLNAIPNPGIKL